jgi:hypothetical protein
MTEREYRKEKRLSYSGIKAFADNRMKYYKNYEAGYIFEDEDSDSMTLGSVADCLELEPEDFDNRFVVATVEKPGGQMGDFTDRLFKRTKECLSVDGVVTRSMNSLMREAYEDVAFDRNGVRVAFKRKTFEQVVEEFANGAGVDFHNQQRATLEKTLIGPGDEEQAMKILTLARNHRNTRALLSLRAGKRYQVINQLKMMFMLWGMEAKGMIDKVIIDHERKIIQPFDMKTTYAPEQFMYNYLKYRYYIQAYVYHIGLEDWASNNGMVEYEVKPMKFMVLDSNAVMDPIIHVCTIDNLKQARDGFWDRGKYYKGTEELCRDIYWHRTKDLWTSSRENYEASGICAIKIFE